MVEQLTIQPFFDTFGQASAPHAAGVNAAATARMERILKSPVDAPGRGILLRAPRSGFGKSHLLSHVQQKLGTTHEFLPLRPLDGSRIDGAAAIEAALRRLTRPLPAGAGLTALDLHARRLFSMALQPLVSSGEVPCQDREAALGALRQRPVETFDFHHSQAVTAHWTKENFEVLGPRLALELSRRTGTSLNESSFWLASLFRFAVAVPEHPGRTGMIIQSSTSEAGVDRYAALLALLSLIGRVVVAADDLEGMHADPQAALRFASFLASARQEAPRVDVVVSLNDDVWDSAFKPALSGGLQDRLGEVEIRLESLDEEALSSLLEARLPGQGAELRHRLGLAPGEFYARRVLRKAAELEEDDDLPVVAVASPAVASSPVVLPPEPEVELKVAEPAVEAATASEEVVQVESTDGDVAFEEAAGLPPAESFELAEAEPIEMKVADEAMPEPKPVEVGVEVPAEEPAERSPVEVTPEVAVGMVSPFTEVVEESAATPVQEEDTGTTGGDRIDDLLRQFRERYGRE